MNQFALQMKQLWAESDFKDVPFPLSDEKLSQIYDEACSEGRNPYGIAWFIIRQKLIEDGKAESFPETNHPSGKYTTTIRLEDTDVYSVIPDRVDYKVLALLRTKDIPYQKISEFSDEGFDLQIPRFTVFHEKKVHGLTIRSKISQSEISRIAEEIEQYGLEQIAPEDILRELDPGRDPKYYEKHKFDLYMKLDVEELVDVFSEEDRQWFLDYGMQEMRSQGYYEDEMIEGIGRKVASTLRKDPS